MLLFYWLTNKCSLQVVVQQTELCGLYVFACVSVFIFVNLPHLSNFLGMGWQTRPDKLTQRVSGDRLKKSVSALPYISPSITFVWREQRWMMDGRLTLSLSTSHPVYSIIFHHLDSLHHSVTCFLHFFVICLSLWLYFISTTPVFLSSVWSLLSFLTACAGCISSRSCKLFRWHCKPTHSRYWDRVIHHCVILQIISLRWLTGMTVWYFLLT